MSRLKLENAALWLHNKLGTSNDLWSGGSISSLLKQEVLRNIRDCFIDLQSQVKLKLLLAFLHIPRRSVEEWKVELEEVIEVASADNDQWVSMLAELIKSFPSTGNLNFQIEENAKVFSDLVTDVRKIVKKYADQVILPLECLYLNRNSFTALVGHLPQPVKHFALKRKPKSAALRAELLQKSSDAASSFKKNPTPSAAIRCRGVTKSLNDTLSMRGKSSPLIAGGFRNTPSMGRMQNSLLNRTPLSRSVPTKKDGGIKLLDIGEQPQGFGRDAKRRKKLAENETPDAKKEKESVNPVATPTVATATPDYAAGLLSSTQLSGTSTSATSTNPAGITYAQSSVIVSPALNPNRELLNTTFQTSNSESSVAPSASSSAKPPSSNPINNSATIGNIASLGGTTVIQVQPAQAVYQKIQQAQGTAIQKKELQLSKEQMIVAQEMFKNAQQVSRDHKALILGFMAGHRENPCPELGDCLKILLSQTIEETILESGGSQTRTVETFFEMNYKTGEWRRSQKTTVNTE